MGEAARDLSRGTGKATPAGKAAKRGRGRPKALPKTWAARYEALSESDRRFVDRTVEALRSYVEAQDANIDILAQTIPSMSTSRLRQFADRKYTGTLLTTAEQIAEHLALEQERIAAGVAADFVETEVSDRIDQLIVVARRDLVMTLGYGPSGLGKSISLRRYGGKDWVRLIHAPLRFAMKATLRSICRALGLGIKGDPDTLAFSIIDEIGGKEMCLIFDDAHRFTPEALDLLAGIYDECQRLSIVLLGQPELHKMIFHRRKENYAQVRSRIAMISDLEKNLESKDVEKIMRLNFPEFPEDVLQRLVVEGVTPGHGTNRRAINAGRAARRIVRAPQDEEIELDVGLIEDVIADMII